MEQVSHANVVEHEVEIAACPVEFDAPCAT